MRRAGERSPALLRLHQISLTITDEKRSPAAGAAGPGRRRPHSIGCVQPVRVSGGDSRDAPPRHRTDKPEAGDQQRPTGGLGQPAFAWAVLRQQWNLGSTLLDMGASGSAAQRDEALGLLAQARNGWLALARADPADGSLASWVRTARLSYGEALGVAGHSQAAIAELSTTVAERRAALAQRPRSAELQRSLVVGLNALGEMLASAGRRGEACGLLVEGSAATERMAANGAVTGLDRDSMVRQLDEARAQFCSNGLTTPAKAL
jgi:hypothetical protein